MELKLAFIGFGNVARAFSRLLDETGRMLAERYDVECRAVAIATARHGSIVSDDRIALGEAAARIERGQKLCGLPRTVDVADALEVIESAGADIVFETTPLDPLRGEPATTYIRRALQRSMHVITANKGPLAFAHRELKATAEQRGISFRFEGAVMDGTPVFNMAEYCLPGARVLGFAGVFNSTTNFILTGMEQGWSFDECLSEARNLGIVEANADYDLDGWDAAIKAVALANVLMEADLRPAQVERTGIRGITRDELKLARDRGMAIRLVARARVCDQGLKLTVAPESVPIATPVGAVRGTSSVLVLETDLMGEIAVLENNPCIKQTAYALMSDLIRVRTEMK
jgi:homoserine dehydrogenase